MTTPTYRFYRRTFLNRPRHHSGAHVIAAIVSDPDELGILDADTSLQIADCYRWIRLDFPLDTARDRANSLYKARLLARVCAEFADALEREADRLSTPVSRPTRVVPSEER